VHSQNACAAVVQQNACTHRPVIRYTSRRRKDAPLCPRSKKAGSRKDAANGSRTRAIKRPYLSLEQISALLKAAEFSTRDKALLRLVLVTALRPSEIFALRWRSINFDTRTMTITETIYRGKLRPYTKTSEEGEAEQLVVPQIGLAALGEWFYHTDHKQDDDFIFPNQHGGFLLERNYQHRVFPGLQVWAREYGAEIPKLNFQILRRTVATHAAELGSLKSVQTIMRHKRAATTADNYVRVIETSVKETAEALAKKLITKEPIK
jgi:integrase